MSNYKIDRLQYIEFDHEPASDELMHFKYVKREKVNGKWRYWYKNTKANAKTAVTDSVKEAKENFEWGYEKGNKRDSGGGVLNERNASAEMYRDSADGNERLARTALDAYVNTPQTKTKDRKWFLEVAESAMEDAEQARADAKKAASLGGKMGQMAGRTVRRIQHQAEKGKRWLDDFLEGGKPDERIHGR